MNIILMGLLASLLAGLATGVGALPILFFKDVSDRVLDVMLASLPVSCWLPPASASSSPL